MVPALEKELALDCVTHDSIDAAELLGDAVLLKRAGSFTLGYGDQERMNRSVRCRFAGGSDCPTLTARDEKTTKP